jgi:hypothetical protein
VTGQYQFGASHGHEHRRWNRLMRTAERLRAMTDNTTGRRRALPPPTTLTSAMCSLFQFASALAIAARSSGDSGVTWLGKNATMRPLLSTTYFEKFHAGSCPDCPRNE